MSIAICYHFSHILAALLLSYQSDLFCVESFAILILRTLSLTHLNLQNCSLGSVGSSILLRALTHNHTLLHINLADNNIDHTAIEALAGCLERNDTLVSLDLHDNPLATSAWTEWWTRCAATCAC